MNEALLLQVPHIRVVEAGNLCIAAKNGQVEISQRLEVSREGFPCLRIEPEKGKTEDFAVEWEMG
ncbi:MAG: hypothetical protein HN531_15305 [Opitutae bacterium]|nr:hypothetical protein [Opitutae bacterium]